MPLTRPIRNVVFDWSGTLVDDLPAVWAASNVCFRKAGCSEMTLEQFRAEFELPFEDFYHRKLPNASMNQLEGWFREAFPTVQDQVSELAHARSMLEFCRDQGLRTFLLSAVHPEHFATQSNSNGFHRLLDHVCVGVRDKRKKLPELIRDLKLLPSETVMIGDMQHDIDAAHAAGVRGFAVLTGYQSREQLARSNPDLMVDDLADLQRQMVSSCHFVVKAGGAPLQLRLPVATVGGLIYDSEGRVLMIRTHKWSNLWGIPGGKIQWGESSPAALVREILEETALVVKDIQFVLAQDCIHSPEFYRDAHFLLLNYTCRVSGSTEVHLNSEAQDFRWIQPQDTLALSLNQPTRILVEHILKKES